MAKTLDELLKNTTPAMRAYLLEGQKNNLTSQNNAPANLNGMSNIQGSTTYTSPASNINQGTNYNSGKKNLPDPTIPYSPSMGSNNANRKREETTTTNQMVDINGVAVNTGGKQNLPNLAVPYNPSMGSNNNGGQNNSGNKDDNKTDLGSGSSGSGAGNGGSGSGSGGSGNGDAGNGGIGNVGTGVSDNYIAAMQNIQSQLDRLNNRSDRSDQIDALIASMQGGRTQYSDYVDKYINMLANRDAFSYDANSDAMYQNYLSQMENLGAKAMKDTMGQAAALTGGYGSSYATAAANGAYNDYINQANQAIPDYYNLAFNQYRSEGEALQDMLNNYINRDESEYNRQLQNLKNLMTLEDRDWSRDYQLARDAISDARYDQQYADSRADTAWEQAYKELLRQDDRNDTAWSQEYQTTQANRTQANADRNYYASLGLASDGQTQLPESVTSGKSSLTSTQYAKLLEDSVNAYNEKGVEGVKEVAGKYPDISVDELQYVLNYAEKYGKLTYTGTGRHNIFTKTDNGYVDQNGTSYTYQYLMDHQKELGLTDDDMKQISKLGKGKTYPVK